MAGVKTALGLALSISAAALLGACDNGPSAVHAAATADQAAPATDARALQRDWDAVITARAVLQGLAVAALCATLAM